MRAILIASLIFICSCMKLDSNLYNLSDQIKEYKLDAYSGEQDFILDENYLIPDSLITPLDLASKKDSEDQPVTIKAIYIGDLKKIDSDTVILYCHGNKWHMDFYWQRAKLLAHVNGKNRYGVMLFDYRGYGLSEGNPDEEGIYADTEACLAWLKQQGLSNDRLIVYGFSLGSAPACEISAAGKNLQPFKLILEAPFASAEVMVQDASQLNMPASYFTDLKINNADKIETVEQPLMWLHGTNDNFLNYKTHGETVYRHHKGVYRQSYLVEGADHGEVPAKAGFAIYLDEIGKFIRRK